LFCDGYLVKYPSRLLREWKRFPGKH